VVVSTCSVGVPVLYGSQCCCVCGMGVLWRFNYGWCCFQLKIWRNVGGKSSGGGVSYVQPGGCVVEMH
jgi:hypothetical protein